VAVAAVDALPGEKPAWNMSFVTSVVALPALLFRRRWPFVTWLLATPSGIWGNALVAPLVALFTVADRTARTWLAGLATAATLVGYFVSAMVSGLPGPVGAVDTLQVLIYAGLFAGMPTALGLLMRARRTLRAQLESLAASQAREQTLVAENRELPGSGHGLIGLRERAELFGGQLTTHAHADGGFELHVTFNG
jgi:hypothetical protein